MLDAELKEYLDAAKGWETDGIVRLKNSERRAWIVAGTAVVLAVLAIIAVVCLTPLKRVELRAVLVDKVTGYSEITSELKDQTLSYQDAKDEHNVQDYVIERERYSNDITGSDYLDIGLWSTPTEADEYAKGMDPNYKDSPLNTFGKDGRKYIHIVSVSLLRPGIAQVRFTRTDEHGGVKSVPTNWIATVTFHYEHLKLKDADQRRNPDGLQVSDYRVDAENVDTVNATQR